MAETLINPLETLVSSRGLTVQRLADSAMLDVRLTPDAPAQQGVQNALGAMLPTDANCFVTAGALRIGWLGPDQWIAIGTNDAVAEAETRLASELADIHHSLVEISGNRACFSVMGTDAADFISVGCALDFAGPSFGPKTCVQTLLARAQVMILRSDRTSGFEIYPRRSFNSYLSLWFRTAAREFTG